MKRGLALAGVLCLLAAAAAVAGLFVAPPAVAAGTWSTERIYNNLSENVYGARTQGDYIVWVTSASDSTSGYSLFVYTISTKQTKRIAGPDLTYHIDEVPLLDGTHVVWEENTLDDEASDIILYDIATGQTTRLSAGAADTFEMNPCVQGDWVVWDGLVTPGPDPYVYDYAVFAYRISTGGPIQLIRWRAHETQPHPTSYRSEDEGPWVSNGKMAWTFVRPDGGNYLGIMDLATQNVEWQWKLPANHRYWPCYGEGDANLMWNGYMLIRLGSSDPQNANNLLDGLWLRSPGQAEPEVLRADAAIYTFASDIKGGVAVWASGGIYLKKPGGQITQLANTSGAMDLRSDGSSLVWSRQGSIWWYNIASGESAAIPNAFGEDPAVAGTRVVWAGDFATGKCHSVYLATRGGAAFPDVPANHAYSTAIAGMAARGIIGGYLNGKFGPDDLVMRQHFAKMIVLTLGLPVDEGDFPNPAVPFVDLGADDPSKLHPHEYVAVCAINNITKGTDSTHFSPTLNIKRQQVLSMVVRAADNLAAGALEEVPAGWAGQLSYADATHGANIKKAECNGLLNGIVGPGGTLESWNTGGNATRGEVAQMLWNLLAKMGD